MTTINKECCPTCGRSVNMREIAIFSSLVSAIFRVWMVCNEKGQYTFTRKEVKTIIGGSDSIIARFGDMVLFGGILYHPDGKKGEYGFNIERAKMFFTGKMAIPTKALKHPITGEITFSDERTIDKIRNLSSFLDENREYIARYEGNSVIVI